LAASALGGNLYAVGGSDDINYALNIVEAYDPTTDTWTTKPSIPTARAALASRVIGRRLFAVGGDDGAKWNKVEAFNPRV
jgi:N-acetylneuraminic acid mutarotase